MAARPDQGGERNGKQLYSPPMRRFLVAAAALLVIGSGAIRAEDWPEFRGKGRAGVWNETGILDKFPEGGLKVLWRTPIKAGMSGPSVVGGRVFITDFAEGQFYRGTERALALDEKTGRVLWTREWAVDYSAAKITMMPWGGPTTTPTVDGDRVYVLGRTGTLLALTAATGDILWQREFKDFKGDTAGNGTSAHPVVEGNLVICFVGGDNGAGVVAFDKMTGKEVWRALTLSHDIGGSAPIVITAAGIRQLIVWHPTAVVSINPATGKIYWEMPFKTYGNVNPGIPVQSGNYLMVSSFNLGSMMMELDDKKPGARMLWRAKETASDVDTDGLHALFSPPIMKDGFVYGICSYGQLRCLNVANGERVWESQSPMAERARFSSAFLVRNGGDRYFINNDRGELIIARLTPQRYEELDRTLLLTATTRPYNRRKLNAVAWMHPAYANGNIYARNDEEIICASLAAPSGTGSAGARK